nr:hypothetical protein CFP56_68649 [Quercus suber]
MLTTCRGMRNFRDVRCLLLSLSPLGGMSPPNSQKAGSLGGPKAIQTLLEQAAAATKPSFGILGGHVYQLLPVVVDHGKRLRTFLRTCGVPSWTARNESSKETACPDASDRQSFDWTFARMTLL